MLNDEFDPHSQHDNRTATDAPAAPGVRRRRTITPTGPVALLSVSGLITVGIIAGVIGSWTTGVIEAAQLREDLMLISCTIGAVGAFVGMTWWLDRRAETRHQEAQRWDEAQRQLMIEQYAAIARKVGGLEQLVEEGASKTVADAARLAAQHIGRLAHRVEQAEATVDQGRKSNEELLGCFDDLALRVEELEAQPIGNVVKMPKAITSRHHDPA